MPLPASQSLYAEDFSEPSDTQNGSSALWGLNVDLVVHDAAALWVFVGENEHSPSTDISR